METGELALSTPSRLDEIVSSWFLGGRDTMLDSNLLHDDTLHVISMLPGYRLAMPIPVIVEDDEGQYLLTDEVFHRFAVGRSFLEAQKALAKSIADYFNTLQEEKARLSKGAQEDYDQMRQYLRSSVS